MERVLYAGAGMPGYLWTRAVAAHPFSSNAPDLIMSRWNLNNTKLETWFERDRAHVELTTLSGETIVEWWDEAVHQAIEDGFLDPRDYHGSAIEYANTMDLGPRTESRPPRRRG